MHICMYICMHVCMYVCMCVCPSPISVVRPSKTWACARSLAGNMGPTSTGASMSAVLNVVCCQIGDSVTG